MQYSGAALVHITIQKYHSRSVVNRWRECEGDGNIDGDRQTAPSAIKLLWLAVKVELRGD